MLQQDKPEEFVIGSGKYSVRYFIENTFKAAGIEIEWMGSGIEEKAIISNNRIIVEVDEFISDHQVETLLSDPVKLKKNLNGLQK